MGYSGTITKLIKYSAICLVLVSPSLLLVSKVFAADTGGYPWADAEAIDPYTYDWGYRVCPTPMQNAGVCAVHNRYKWGIKYYLSDPWRYDLRNCTSYLAWRVNQEFGISIAGWGNASNWDNAAIGRFEVSNTPRAGDIAVWEGGYGHVAFVTKVYPNGLFEVDQYNNAGTGQFSHQLRQSAHHFIHLKSGKTAANPKTNSGIKSVKTATAQAAANKKQEVIKPKLPSLNGSLVPKPGVGDVISSSPLPSTREVEYLIEYSPISEELNAYAIRHTSTNSGKIEVSQSSLKDRNTRFQSTAVSSNPVRQEGQTKFAMADYNRDRRLDLYILKVGGTKSGKLEVVILDGATGYSKKLVETATQSSTEHSDLTSYKVADKNNDGKLDIYAITSPTPTQNTKFEVLDGAKQYNAILNVWLSEEDVPADSSTNYYIGDHDGDGQVDIYQSYQAKENKGRYSVDIYETKKSLKVASRKLIVGSPTVQPDVILPLIKIKDDSTAEVSQD